MTVAVLWRDSPSSDKVHWDSGRGWNPGPRVGSRVFYQRVSLLFETCKVYFFRDKEKCIGILTSSSYFNLIQSYIYLSFCTPIICFTRKKEKKCLKLIQLWEPSNRNRMHFFGGVKLALLSLESTSKQGRRFRFRDRCSPGVQEAARRPHQFSWTNYTKLLVVLYSCEILMNIAGVGEERGRFFVALWAFIYKHKKFCTAQQDGPRTWLKVYSVLDSYWRERRGDFQRISLIKRCRGTLWKEFLSFTIITVSINFRELKAASAGDLLF